MIYWLAYLLIGVLVVCFPFFARDAGRDTLRQGADEIGAGAVAGILGLMVLCWPVLLVATKLR